MKIQFKDLNKYDQQTVVEIVNRHLLAHKCDVNTKLTKYRIDRISYTSMLQRHIVEQAIDFIKETK